MNPGEPSSKAKYVARTDSELVPRGKGEKMGGTPNEIVPETVCEQTERASPQGGVISCLLKNDPASCHLVQRNFLRKVRIAKASFNERSIVLCGRPETR